MIYNVVIEEYISDTFEMEADSLEKVHEMYRKCEIVLEAGELLYVHFSIY